jgi:hypothetical protein
MRGRNSANLLVNLGTGGAPTSPVLFLTLSLYISEPPSIAHQFIDYLTSKSFLVVEKPGTDSL